jgi:hypothetical protein
MQLSQVPQEVFDTGLMSRDVHDRLLVNLERIVRKAGVPVQAVFTRLSEFCEKETDYEWVRNLRSPEDAGLVYIGKIGVPVDAKMRAIVGACLRNYTDARMMTVQDVIKQCKDDTMPEPTVLLIPNFCVDKNDGGDIASWDVSNLLGLLISRLQAGQKTVLHISSWTALEKQYGSSFKEHLEAHYCLYGNGFFTAAKNPVLA